MLIDWGCIRGTEINFHRFSSLSLDALCVIARSVAAKQSKYCANLGLLRAPRNDETSLAMTNEN